MADQIDVYQVLAQVEYLDPPKIRVSQLLAQVEYVVGEEEPPPGGEVPGLFFAQG